MFLRRTFKINVVAITGIVLLLALPLPGLSQSEPDQAEEPSELMEEVIVYGAKPLIKLKQEMRGAEDALFDLFNSINTDDNFDIRCYKEVPTGSKIPRRVCKTNWFRNQHTWETQKLMRGEPFEYRTFKRYIAMAWFS